MSKQLIVPALLLGASAAVAAPLLADATKAGFSEGQLTVVGGTATAKEGTVTVTGGTTLLTAGRARGATTTFGSTGGIEALVLNGGGRVRTLGFADVDVVKGASIFGDGSSFSVNGGDITFLDSSTLSFENSDLTVTGGSLSLNGSSLVRLSGVVVQAPGGIEARGAALVTFRRSEPVRAGGDEEGRANYNGTLLFDDTDGREKITSRLSVIGGSIVLADEAEFELIDSGLGAVTSSVTVGGKVFDRPALGAYADACGTTLRFRAADGSVTCEKPEAVKNPKCLSSSNKTPNWECEDTCLATETGPLCGKTGHL